MRLRHACLVGMLLLAAYPPATARTVLQFTSDNLPQRIYLPSSGLFLNSDSLSIGARLLLRGEDYSIDQTGGSIDVSAIGLAPTDTLSVIFHAVPAWVARTYGRPIPEASTPSNPIPLPSDLSPTTRTDGFARDIKISGAKTFRFSSRTQGEADFGQSLDLRINGELSPGLELTGALTDRGYDPSYGSSTSRLTELDKLNLQLRSRTLHAQIGDITLTREYGGPAKQVSGAAVKLTYPSWHLQGGAARPKGRFQSITLTGQDRFQGPYRMGGEQTTSPVVPGSETVWLDGRQLERGADKDYTVDYPAGQITFTARHPIDRRSRIEIDFEPLATSFRQEMLTLGGGVSIRDSLLTVSVSQFREGDDQSQLLIGELSDEDRALLETSGDQDLYETGVVPDTAGDYILVADSLPDTVWTYVGSGNGEYRITFSYVGNGSGEYRYVGGNSYQFVGANNGDHAPVRKIPRPERTDYYASQIGLCTSAGRLSADIRQTSHDRNLFSSLGDADNDGVYYRLEYMKDWVLHGEQGNLKIERRFREPDFNLRERLNQADFSREFFLPYNWRPTENELLHQAELTIAPLTGVVVTPSVARLTYGDQFKVNSGEVGVSIRPSEKLNLRSTIMSLASTFDTSAAETDGDMNGFSTSASYQLGHDLRAQATYEYDSRHNDYSGAEAGLRFRRFELTGGSSTESIRYERYDEDSLHLNWFASGTRDRILANSTRQLGNLSITSELGWQRLDDITARSSNFLGRGSLSYSDSRRRLQTQASYLISNELRNERGISYLEVEPGRGNYRLENGQYLPDPYGNYIQVEELLSERAEVTRGEKSFLFSKELKGVAVRVVSNIREEMVEGGKRSAWWVLPFYSDGSQPYLLLSRRYDGELRLFQWKSFYAVNLAITDELEKRTIGGAGKERKESRGSVTLKQASGEMLLEQSAEIFRSDRDQYYSGAGSIDGMRGTILVRRPQTQFEWSAGLSVRHAVSEQDDKADLFAVLIGGKLRAVQRGELRVDLELYRQSIELLSDDFSYTLTDDHNGKRGALWTVGFKYAVRQGLQANFNFSGRHSDDRPGRVSGRGEVVATF